LHYDDHESWLGPIAAWLDETFPAKALEGFREDVQPDWVGWLSVRVVGGPLDRDELVTLVADILAAQYAGIRLYHGTRLHSLSVLHSEGLKAWTPDELRDLARREFSPYSGPALDRALEAPTANPEHRGGRLYTFRMLRDARNTLQGMNGFTRNGSEWLSAVAGGLGLKDYVASKQANTTGYLISLDLPWRFLERADILHIAEDSLLTAISKRFFPDAGYTTPACGWVCVALFKTVPWQYVAATEEFD